MYKTKLCNEWERSGAFGKPSCVRGETCKFAHGKSELRSESAPSVPGDRFDMRAGGFGKGSTPWPAAGVANRPPPMPWKAPVPASEAKQTWDHSAFEALQGRQERINPLKAAMKAFEY